MPRKRRVRRATSKRLGRAKSGRVVNKSSRGSRARTKLTKTQIKRNAQNRRGGRTRTGTTTTTRPRRKTNTPKARRGGRLR